MSEKLTYVKLTAAVIAAIFFIGLVIFLPAWTIFWLEGWIYLIIFTIFFFTMVIYFQKNNPGLLKSRMKAKPRERWDIVIMIFLSLAFVSAFIIPGFDAVRFRWSQMHPILEIMGFILLSLSLAIIFLVMRENTFASKAVRVDQETKVITTGPYKYVRHPMYVGFNLLFISHCFALGSYFSLIPASICVGLLFLRTHFEDKMLHEELEGYNEYAKKTRYRMIPWIW